MSSKVALEYRQIERTPITHNVVDHLAAVALVQHHPRILPVSAAAAVDAQ
jgi:hypothetical protein